MNWNLTENGNTLVPGNYLIAAIYDPDAPTVVLQSVVLPQPYTSTKNFSFTGLEEKIYNFILWENSTPTVGGSSRNNFSLQPTQNTTIVRADLKLKAGQSVNFDVGGTSYVADAPNDLTGWQYDIERKPQGTQYEGETVAIDTNGFHLLVAGDLFGPDEEWVLHFLPQTAVTAPVPQTGQVIIPQVITGDIILDNTFTGKTGLVQGSSSHLTITLPALSTMAVGKVIGFISAGGSHLSAIFQCASDSIPNTFLWSSGVSGRPTQLCLGQNEEIKFFRANDAGGNPVYYVLEPSDTIRMAGEIVYENLSTKLNMTFADGGERDWNDFARLRKYAQSLPTSQLTTELLWGQPQTINGVVRYPNMGKYTLGDGSSFFRVPLLSKYGSLRAVDGVSRIAGDFEAEMVGPHDQPMHGSGSIFGSGGPFFLNTASVNRSYSGGGSDGFGRGLSVDTTLRTGFNSGTENRMNNTGVYALIRT